MSDERRLSPLATLAKIVELIGAVISIAAVVLAGMEYFLHTPIFYNPSKQFTASYDRDVLPLVELMDLGPPEIAKAINANDGETFVRASLVFVEENKLQGKVIIGVETAERIVKCHLSYTCLIEGYLDYEQPLRRFWYAYRPTVRSLRGKFVAVDFGMTLEAEAKRILEKDREAGRLP